MTGMLAALLSLATLPARAATTIVDVGNNYYAPQHAVIQSAEAVQWLFVAGFHSATAAAGQVDNFDSGLLDPGSAYAHAFDRPGAVTYYCTAHGADLGGGRVGGMSGSVTVLPRSGPALFAQGTCPGVVTVDFSGGTPGGNLAIVSSSTQGNAVIPGGPCVGRATGLGSITLRGIFALDGAGDKVLSPTMPGGVCMQFVQALDLTTCTLSNVAVIPW